MTERDAAPTGPDQPAGPADLGALTFEQLLERLEGLIAHLSSGEVGIEEAAGLYEESERVYAAARDRLDAVQARIAALGAEADRPGV